VHGLAEVGARLRERVEDVLEAFVARLRGELAAPGVQRRDRAELEDHAATMISNLAQSLVVIEETGGLESDLLRDGGEIQHVISQLHGRQRYRIGWTEAALMREYEILDEEIAALVRRHLPEERGDASTALEVLHRLVARAAATSARAFRQAEQSSAGASQHQVSG
jgi:hypothetical protein